MVLAITVNIVLAAIVFAGVILLIMRAIRSSDATAPTVAVASRQVRSAPARRRSGAIVPARPWA